MNEMMIFGLMANIANQLGLDLTSANSMDVVKNFLAIIGGAETAPAEPGQQSGTTPKKVYVVTETDSEDPTWCHNEVFDTLEGARKRMLDLYKENVVDRADLVVSSKLEKMCASAEMVDDVVLAWNIKECEVQ